jgi:lipoprotein-anchoring transpeptidase ErfK/SrfK
MTVNANAFAVVFAANMLMGAGAAQAQQPVRPDPLAQTAPLTPQVINAAPLDVIPPTYVPRQQQAAVIGAAFPESGDAKPRPSPSVARLQILLDRAGASPGVIDGYDGENVRRAILAFKAMHGLHADGVLDPEVIAQLNAVDPVIGSYTITPDDAASIVPAIPKDYGEMAKLKYLGYTSLPEELAERFHMDIDLLKALNPAARFAPGELIFGAAIGAGRQGQVVRIVADKALGQVRAYAADNTLLAAYPATIGSESNPSPSGVHTVLAVVHNPTYTYNPEVNFKQGDNNKVLTIPPGPNGPVGSVWIDLSEPTFGIHGTPEPSMIDKNGSHGCVRLTNWDAEELAGMVSKGAEVDFIS